MTPTFTGDGHPPPKSASWRGPPTRPLAPLLHFSRRGRYRSLGYAFRYLFDFGAGIKPPKVINKLDGVYIPINPFDTMFLALKKKP